MPWFDLEALVVKGFFDQYGEDRWLEGGISIECARTWAFRNQLHVMSMNSFAGVKRVWHISVVRSVKSSSAA